MNWDFTNKVVLVTGASRGIGQGIAEAFLHAGAVVLATATSEAPTAWMADRMAAGEPLHYIQADFSVPGWQDALMAAIERLGGVDVCINNAGINKVADVREVDPDDYRRILEVNLVAPALLTGLVAPLMIRRGGGRIVNISSIFGIGSRAGRISYSSSKAGLLGQTRAAALDLAPQGVLVNAVAPGFVRTELTERVLGEQGMADAASRLPMRRLAEVADIVPAVLFLASAQNSYITGQVLAVDGGYLAE